MTESSATDSFIGFGRRNSTALRSVFSLVVLGLLSVGHVSAQAVAIRFPPAHSGTLDGKGGCKAKWYDTTGFQPSEGSGHPLFLYFVGTTPTAGDAYNSGVPMAVTKQMAERGFVALSVAYDNTYGALMTTDRTQQLDCLFNAANETSIIQLACSLPGSNVDCNAGIAIWGHSQGGLLAIKAHDFDERVRAVVTMGTGLNVLPYSIEPTRLRVLNGETDVAEHTPEAMGMITGANAPAVCPASKQQCLRPDGSGWVIVPAVDGLTGGHCWFMKNGCFGDLSGAAAFLDPNPEVPYTLASNADWLEATLARP